jgi:hypothetical protein
MCVLARLAPGAALAGARSDIAGIMRQLRTAVPDTNAGQTATVAALSEALFQDYQPALWTLLAAVGVVLLSPASSRPPPARAVGGPSERAGDPQPRLERDGDGSCGSS